MMNTLENSTVSLPYSAAMTGIPRKPRLEQMLMNRYTVRWAFGAHSTMPHSTPAASMTRNAAKPRPIDSAICPPRADASSAPADATIMHGNVMLLMTWESLARTPSSR